MRMLVEQASEIGFGECETGLAFGLGRLQTRTGAAVSFEPEHVPGAANIAAASLVHPSSQSETVPCWMTKMWA